MKKQNKLLSPEELKDEFGAGKRLQAQWRNQRLIPFMKLGHRSIFYRRADVEKFLESRTMQAIGQEVA